MTRRIVTMRVVMAALALAIFGWATGDTMAQVERDEVEQPAYDVLDTVGAVEIRQYGPRLAAETDMGPEPRTEGERDDAFMTLAAYIFAQKRQGAEVEMTAPVAIEQAKPIAMTAPVAMEPGDQGQVMRFFMPAEYTLDTLPRPVNDQIRIVTVPAQTLAVLRFSGDATAELVADRTTALLESLEDSPWEPVAEPGYFGYDPPMTPPDQRQNEVYVEVLARG